MPPSRKSIYLLNPFLLICLSHLSISVLETTVKRNAHSANNPSFILEIKPVPYSRMGDTYAFKGHVQSTLLPPRKRYSNKQFCHMVLVLTFLLYARTVQNAWI